MQGNILRITPEKCLQDERVLVEMQNLPPGSDVTLTSHVDDELGNNFFTYSHFRANEQGKIDLSKDGSMGGSYRGVFQMGPIGCLRPGPETFKYYRYINLNVPVPMTVKFTVLKGHLNEKEAYKPDENKILDSAIHERIYLAEGTKRIPVREGRVRGTLFIPGGDGPFPGVIDMFGGSSFGSLFEFRAAQFAARGIAALALTFCDYDNIPADIPYLDIEYFHEAVEYLLKQDKVKKPNVAVIGSSKGCDLAFSIATFIPEVKAAICINGMSLNPMMLLKTKDKIIQAPPTDLTKIKMIEPEVLSFENATIDPSSWPQCQIPIEEADAHFLMISCKDDKMIKADIEHERVVDILKKCGKENYEIVKYEGAGHLLESPYAPFAGASLHRGAKKAFIWGGNAYQHVQASEDAWKRSLEFIRKHIT